MDELFRPWPRVRLFFSRLRKGLRLLLECGLPAVLYIARKKNLLRTLGLPPLGYLFSGLTPYEYWIKKHELSPRDLARLKPESRQSSASARFSVLMAVTAGDSASAVEASSSSLLAQTDGLWELLVCRDAGAPAEVLDILKRLALDPRVRISKAGAAADALDEALKGSTGDFVALLDPGDVLAPFALGAASETLRAKPETDLLYSDEDRLSDDGKRRFEPHFKPDWSPDLLRSCNYIGGLAVLRKSLLEAVGGFKAGLEGERHYDLILRASEKARAVSHVQKMLLHRGAGARAEPAGPSAARRALAEHVRRLGYEADVLPEGEGRYRVRYRIEEKPEVSIIIPTKDKASVLRTCVESVLKHTSYPNYRIFVVDNQSREAETLRYYEELKREPRVTVLSFDEPFNFSKLVNFGASRAGGDVLVLLNNDTEILAPGWLEAMLEHAQRKEVGAVGCLLRYPHDKSVQHAGVILGLEGISAHGHHLQPAGSPGYFGRIRLVQNLSAVTAACLMTRRDAFEAVGGFDERYSRALNDIDFCLRLRERGLLVVYTPYVDILHHESLSRGSDFTEEGWPIFKKAVDDFEERWGTLLRRGDPYYNPGLSDVRGGFSVKL